MPPRGSSPANAGRRSVRSRASRRFLWPLGPGVAGGGRGTGRHHLGHELVHAGRLLALLRLLLHELAHDEHVAPGLDRVVREPLQGSRRSVVRRHHHLATLVEEIDDEVRALPPRDVQRQVAARRRDLDGEAILVAGHADGPRHPGRQGQRLRLLGCIVRLRLAWQLQSGRGVLVDVHHRRARVARTLLGLLPAAAPGQRSQPEDHQYLAAGIVIGPRASRRPDRKARARSATGGNARGSNAAGGDGWAAESIRIPAARY